MLIMVRSDFEFTFCTFLSLTMTQQLGVCCLLENNDSRSERGDGDIQTTAAGQGPEFWCEMF